MKICFQVSYFVDWLKLYTVQFKLYSACVHIAAGNKILPSTTFKPIFPFICVQVNVFIFLYPTDILPMNDAKTIKL